MLEHPSYSTDLVLCDILVPAAEKILAGWKYKKRTHLGSAIFLWLKSMSEEKLWKGISGLQYILTHPRITPRCDVMWKVSFMQKIVILSVM